MKKIISVMIAMVILISYVMGCATVTVDGGPIDPGRLTDGIYTGSATNGPVRVTAKVTIADQRITEIQLVEHRNWRGRKAVPVIPDRIIAAQSTQVDAVSGATASSYAIMNAVENAVRQAR